MDAQTILSAAGWIKAERSGAEQQVKIDCRRDDRPPRVRRSGGSGTIAAGIRKVGIIVVCLALGGCATMSAPHIGKTARPENRNPLSDLPRTETTWAGKDLKLHYRAVQAGGDLEISGFVEFDSNLAKYPVVESFRIYLNYLDADGVVLDSKLLWATAVNSEQRFVRWTFERRWPVPPQATALGFSYRGGVGESGGDSSFSQTKTGWEVYQAP